MRLLKSIFLLSLVTRETTAFTFPTLPVSSQASSATTLFSTPSPEDNIMVEDDSRTSRNAGPRKHRRGAGRGGGRGDEAKKVRMDAPSKAAPSPAAAPAAAAGQDFKSRTSSTTRSQLTTEPFAALNVNPYVKQAIKETLGYEFMTKVQAQTLPTTLLKTNVIAKAKTGTGKTISFLIPAIEAALANKNKKATTPLILSPTRELANA
jgi:hypothetical protein